MPIRIFNYTNSKFHATDKKHKIKLKINFSQSYIFGDYSLKYKRLLLDMKHQNYLF